jgi:hypothetical protein
VSPARERDTLESLMVEVQELTRVCAAQIENRTVKLEKLLAEADARLAEFKTEPSAAPKAGPKLADDLRRAPEFRESTDPVLTRVLELAEQGKPHASIAREVGLPIGKVDLMIRLNRRATA